MAGLRRICKMYGRMKIGGVMWLWDYANDEPVRESEMPEGSARRKASDKAQGAQLKAAYESLNLAAQAATTQDLE